MENSPCASLIFFGIHSIISLESLKLKQTNLQRNIMKKLLFLSLLVTGASLQAVLITLPEAKVLTARLQQAGFDHFIEKTDIVKNLAGQQKEALGVSMAVELALYDYNQYLKNPMMATMMQMRKPQLIGTLLQDSPDAVKELKDQGLLD